MLRHLSPEALQASLSGDGPVLAHRLGVDLSGERFNALAVLRLPQDELGRDRAYLPWSAPAIVLKERPQMIAGP